MFKKIFGITLLVGVGLLIAGFVIAKGDWNNIRAVFISDEDYQEAELTGSGAFDSVEINLMDHQVYFYYSEDDSYKIIYFESDYDKVEVETVGGVLKVRGRIKPRVRCFNWRFKSNKVARMDVYLPKGFDGLLDASVTSGSINIHEFTLSKVILDVTSGEINITNTTVDSILEIELTSGDMNLENVAAKSLDLEATSGDIKVRNSSIETEIYIEVTSGAILVETSTSKQIFAAATSGKVVLQNVTAEDITSKVQSGRIDILVSGTKVDYEVDVDISSGSFYYLGKKESDRRINRGAPHNIKVSASSGTIKVNFN